MEYQTSKDREVTKKRLGHVIDEFPGELAEVLMDKKPYLRDIELFILQNPDCEAMFGFKVSGGRVQVLNITVTKKYIK